MHNSTQIIRVTFISYKDIFKDKKALLCKDDSTQGASMKHSTPTFYPTPKPTFPPTREPLSYHKLHKICICIALFCTLSSMASTNESSQNATTQDQNISEQTTNKESIQTTQGGGDNLITSSNADDNNDNQDTTQNPLNQSSQPSDNSQNASNITDTTDAAQNPPNTPKTKGGFVGIESSYVGMKYEEKGVLSANSGTRDAFSGGGIKVGLLGGYRYFFTQGIGLRGYANIDYFKSDSKVPIDNIEALHYGINADFMMNFYTHKYFEIGAFVGLGLGGVHYFGNGISTLRSEASTSNQSYKVKQNSLEVGMQLGAQTVIYKSVGLEFIARIPFMPHYFINSGSEASVISRQFNQNYSLGARILYNF